MMICNNLQESLEGERMQYVLPDGSMLEVTDSTSMRHTFDFDNLNGSHLDLTLTPKITSAQVVKTLVTNNSSF